MPERLWTIPLKMITQALKYFNLAKIALNKNRAILENEFSQCLDLYTESFFNGIQWPDHNSMSI